MRRIEIAAALTIILLASTGVAQQKASNASTNSDRSDGPTPPPGAIIGGDGTPNYIPIWATRNYLLSSVVYQASGGNVGIGTTNPTAALDVNGNINAATTYQIGGNNVVNIGSPRDFNLFLGPGAGQSNVTGLGQVNTFVGYEAGYNNTEGLGNTFTGSRAGYLNTMGDRNTFTGDAAGYNNSIGDGNTFTGNAAGAKNTTGDLNTFTGIAAGTDNTDGARNTFIGSYAGEDNTTGNGNTFVGGLAGLDNTDGARNTFIGASAGSNNATGSDDIFIGNATRGADSSESSTIRIGVGQSATYIAGIYNSTSSGGIPVYVNSDGQLGTQTSSLRFKEQVRDMGDSSYGLMKLRPVTFLYKPEYEKGQRTLQYGLIAEEVAQVYPELVAYDPDGNPYSVRYQYLSTMLLNELQKQYRRAAAQAEVIEAQEQKIDHLEQRLLRLETLAEKQAQSAQR
jgi:Chaperone of endosialidase